MRVGLEFLMCLVFVSCWFLVSGQVPHASEINTGSRSRYNIAPVGSNDPHWCVAYGDSSHATTSFVPAKVVGICDAAWPVPEAYNANWITYDFGANCEHLAYGCVDLYFRREMVLPATDDCGVPIEENYCLTLNLRADNNIYAVSVNGVKYYQHNLPGDPYKYNGAKNEVHLNLCQGWGEGINTILVHVKSCPTLAGLLVQGIPVLEKPKTFLGKDTVLCNDQSFVLVSPWENTSWYDETIGKTKTVNQDGNYWAKYTDKDGCTILDTIAVRFGLKTYVPGSFSPNQDGINDCFVPLFSNKSFTLYEFRVFDRQGTLVYQTTDSSACWDGQSRGKPCAEGVYVYAILLQNGECASTVVKGALTLLY